MQLGFVVKPLARPELKSHDSRRWQNHPHLSVSLAYLRDVFTYLGAAHIGMYRMSSDLAPYATHPDMPQFHRQVAECEAELAEVGALAARLNLRLSFHPSQHVVLNSPDEDLVAKSAADLIVQAAILDGMGLGPEAVVVTHMGGVYGDRETARGRFVMGFERLPEAVRRRLALENDDRVYTPSDLLPICAATGIPFVFDVHHHRCLADGRTVEAITEQALATWNREPLFHLSSPKDGWQSANPRPHHDFIDPADLPSCWLPLTITVEVEAKAKELALQRLQADLAASQSS